MARVGEIRLYPIKGLDPVIVTEARLLGSGALEWDRRFALVDSRGRFLNGKNRIEVHAIRASFQLATAEVALEGQSYSLTHDGDAIARWITDRLGERFAWIEDTANGFPDDTEASGPTLVSEASLAAVAGWFALEREQTRRRFRANITVEGPEPFGEDRWYGSSIRVGDVTVQVINPCARCVVPSRDPFTGVQDAGFQKRFAELRKQHLPGWADPHFFDHHYRFTVNTRIPASEAGKVIRAGDEVAG
jgi:uncharacterized protein YcbX